ncbi:MAG: ferrous iron transport protein A [Candidatus Protistobacter heckmanni]|nr:ferrous iron transport protein A [Candidatus Protistobacter heckmanni]
MFKDFKDTDLSASAHHLGLLRKGQRATVVGMAESGSADQLALRTRLMELGFVPGEPIQVVAESFPGGDPIAVRLGNTTFALRRHEAAMVRTTAPQDHE